MTSLENHGWSNFQQQYHHITTEQKELSIGRVLSIQGFRYVLITMQGEWEAELSGKLLYSSDAEDLPKVGDWVLYMHYDTMGYIISTLPRMNALTRKTPGEKTERQVLAANVDYALIVQSLDRDFNMMRLDRYRVQILACGIRPVIILNKCDLVENPEGFVADVEAQIPDCPVYFCSTYSGYGLETLKNRVLEKCKTYILVGSSGVGKSSLLNALADGDKQKTGGTSESTSKGKHTTTTRDLFCLPNGSLVIDTPGMREFGVTEEGLHSHEELFPLIQQFAAQCRFPDCSHEREPGCAVRNALDTGALDQQLYDSYRKLVKEQKRFSINAEDKKRMEKQFGRITREAKNHRKKYKF